MLSAVESSLWSNELLKVLSNDPNLSDASKKAFGKISQKSNTWKTEIEDIWKAVEFPTLSESDIIRMNCVWKKDIESKNKIRENQRQFWLSQGNEQAAALIPDILDTSMHAKSCVVRSEVRCQGWLPREKVYTTILYNRKPDMSCLEELVERCPHSKAINLPKTVINLIKHGVDSGYGDSHYASIFLQLIKVHLPESFLAAQTYAKDTSALFNYLLNLIDTTGEIGKCRVALKNVTRKVSDPISVVILKVKAITTSLYFLVSPHGSLDSITRKADKSSIEAIYSLVSEATKSALVKWKRRAVELDRGTSLSDFLECVAALEEDETYKITRDLKLPNRFSESDVTCFFSKFNMKRPSPNRSRESTPVKPEGKISRDSSKESNSGRPHSSHSDKSARSYSASSARGDENKRSDKRSEEERGRSRSKKLKTDKKKTGKGEYGFNTNSCRKCMGRHSSASCNRYPYFFEKLCPICKAQGKDLYHPADHCRFSKSRYVTPSPVRSPVSYSRKQKDSEGNNQKSFFY